MNEPNLTARIYRLVEGKWIPIGSEDRQYRLHVSGGRENVFAPVLITIEFASDDPVVMKVMKRAFWQDRFLFLRFSDGRPSPQTDATGSFKVRHWSTDLAPWNRSRSTIFRLQGEAVTHD